MGKLKFFLVAGFVASITTIVFAQDCDQLYGDSHCMKQKSLEKEKPVGSVIVDKICYEHYKNGIATKILPYEKKDGVVVVSSNTTLPPRTDLEKSKTCQDLLK